MTTGLNPVGPTATRHRIRGDLAARYVQAEARRRRMVPILIVLSVLVASLATLLYRG